MVEIRSGSKKHLFYTIRNNDHLGVLRTTYSRSTTYLPLSILHSSRQKSYYIFDRIGFYRFGSILSVSARFYRFRLDSIGFGSILSVSARFYRLRLDSIGSARFYRFRLDSIGFGSILSVSARFYHNEHGHDTYYNHDNRWQWLPIAASSLALLHRTMSSLIIIGPMTKNDQLAKYCSNS
jgi:hypothetical protein